MALVVSLAPDAFTTFVGTKDAEFNVVFKAELASAFYGENDLNLPCVTLNKCCWFFCN